MLTKVFRNIGLWGRLIVILLNTVDDLFVYYGYKKSTVKLFLEQLQIYFALRNKYYVPALDI